MDNAHQAKLEAARQRFKRLPDAWQLSQTLGIFIGAGGWLRRTSRGYRARCYATHPAKLIGLEELYGGRVHSLERAKVSCTIEKKEAVLKLLSDLNKLMPICYPLDLITPPRSKGRPKKCKHCGNSVNNHDPECYDAVRES